MPAARRGGGCEDRRARSSAFGTPPDTTGCHDLFTATTSAGSGSACLSIFKPGKPVTMNERVDWAAMSDEEFIALVRQLMDAPPVPANDED